MAFNINGIVCQEIVQGYTEEADVLEGLSSRKGYLCAWVDRFTVAKGLLGLSSTTKAEGAITIYAPSPHPELHPCYCRRVSFEPKGSPTKGSYQMTFPQCIVWAEYGSMPWNFQQLDNPYQQIDPASPYVYAEQRMSSSYEMLQLPGSGCVWATGGLSLQQPATLRICYVEIEISIKQLPYMPMKSVYAQAGTCNSGTFLQVTAGKLMFNGVDTQQVFSSDGTPAQEGTFRFTARSLYRWDQQYDEVNHRFDTVYFAGGTTPLVATSDFSTIIPGVYQQNPLTRIESLI